MILEKILKATQQGIVISLKIRYNMNAAQLNIDVKCKLVFLFNYGENTFSFLHICI